MKESPDHSWLEMECVCCGQPEHIYWWQKISRKLSALVERWGYTGRTEF